MFAGPNGSGKSTLYHKIKDKFNLRFGIYLNADEINELLIRNSFLDINQFGVKADLSSFKTFFFSSGWSEYVRDSNYVSKWKFTGNIVSIRKSSIKLYDSAIFSDYIRTKFIESGLTFTFETVMSHPSKIDFISKAAVMGYKIYLYFISTDDYSINQNRVKIRVRKGGHDVSNTKIKQRYMNTMNQLKEAAMKSYRTYLFDNTTNLELVLSINPKKEVVFEKTEIPSWVSIYLINRNSE